MYVLEEALLGGRVAKKINSGRYLTFKTSVKKENAEHGNKETEQTLKKE